MIRLPSTLAALTAPLVASSTAYQGIPIGRSLLDGRPFHLSPVLADASVLPSTNSLALGGLGSGKSTTAKVRARREILHHGHQSVVIDSFGEHSAGEWAAMTRSLDGRVIEAGSFALNPCSELFAPAVREQLLRSLIAAVEPDALTTRSTHALQHALSHPKATTLGGLVDALITPEDGRWPAAQLTEWGVGVAIALSRYTEGSLVGLFDGRESDLPPTDLPIISFDFSRLDRNSEAIPALMAAVSCWVEQVWLPQSTAVHRHFIVEEAWQILASPATARLIQRMLKNSRRAGMSLDAVMHTLSDLGDGPARDLARLCEVVHVGRLGPEEAAATGALLGLPDWAISEIPSLGPGQAVWRVGPHHVDIIETRLDSVEAGLTDTSSRRRAAQQAYAADVLGDVDQDVDQDVGPELQDDDLLDAEEHQEHADDRVVSLADVLRLDDEEDPEEETTADPWEEWMPPTVVDSRHTLAIQAAREGRCSEAADIAAIGEREDIRTHGITSPEALGWLETRAQVADLCGSPGQAVQLRATVARMAPTTTPGPDPEFWRKEPAEAAPYGSPVYGAVPPPADAAPDGPLSSTAPAKRRRRWWPLVLAVAALALTAATIVQATTEAQQREDRKAVADHYRGRSGAKVTLDGVGVDVVAQWSSDRTNVVVQLRSYFDRNAKYLRIDAGTGQTVSSEAKDGWYPKSPELRIPVTDPLADVTVRVAVGGRDWKAGSRALSQEVRLSPDGIAYDVATGDRLPSDL
ncbi:hypothetical protein ACF1CG_36960 [Streptomyces sp. NPDC014773]|uniref:hypothetical protein n=1 Tax=Streptomyces sp. NPDC014773 TaxID=3364908 RepID=UPI0036FAB879